MDSRRKPAPEGEECFREAAEEDFAVDLMIWAALLNRPKLAEIFWHHTHVCPFSCPLLYCTVLYMCNELGHGLSYYLAFLQHFMNFAQLTDPFIYLFKFWESITAPFLCDPKVA